MSPAETPPEIFGGTTVDRLFYSPYTLARLIKTKGRRLNSTVCFLSFLVDNPISRPRVPPQMLNKIREPGVSFIVRARNEADALFKNILSLRTISVPYEIAVTLHRCSDCSEEVLKTFIQQGVPITYTHDSNPVSRAGYETYVTPSSHPYSLSAFSQRAFERAKYNWLVRWDADFEATDFFRDFVNTTLSLDATEPRSYQLACALGDRVICHEEYMINTFLGCKKYLLWETYEQESPRVTTRLGAVCARSLPPSLLKEYWKESPWFLQPDMADTEIAARYAALVAECGPEPEGFARSNSPNFDEPFAVIQKKHADLVSQGIYVD